MNTYLDMMEFGTNRDFKQYPDPNCPENNLMNHIPLDDLKTNKNGGVLIDKNTSGYPAKAGDDGNCHPALFDLVFSTQGGGFFSNNDCPLQSGGNITAWYWQETGVIGNPCLSVYPFDLCAGQFITELHPVVKDTLNSPQTVTIGPSGDLPEEFDGESSGIHFRGNMMFIPSGQWHFVGFQCIVPPTGLLKSKQISANANTTVLALALYEEQIKVVELPKHIGILTKPKIPWYEWPQLAVTIEQIYRTNPAALGEAKSTVADQIRVMAKAKATVLASIKSAKLNR